MKTSLLSLCLLLLLSACAATAPGGYSRTKVVLGGIGVMCCQLVSVGFAQYNLTCGDGVKIIQPANFIVTDEPCGEPQP